MTRVLIVEDEEDLRFLLRMGLERAGFEVTDHTCAEDAVGTLDEHDVLLLDIRLPGISGLDLLRQHVEGGGRAPAVVMSAHAGKDVRAEALQAGAKAMLNKPFDMEHLVSTLQDVAA